MVIFHFTVQQQYDDDVYVALTSVVSDGPDITVIRFSYGF